METKHTPGPWKVHKTSQGDLAIDGKNGSYVAGIDYRLDFPSVQRRKMANADLIAAAPELLEACKDALAVLQIAHRYFPKSIKNGDTFHLLNVEANSIKAAIAKAEGKK